ncbi:predicted protein [Arabidopsis lyrata subsp. lyrata]|uniref:Predicted protein n=1 Tax=Arabidopsis lyrata subsp. lyrata TaxID=81972 RepID=D7LMT4_ARALL|nr:predicted protein [Arabidopsis lyrata subsp. lyrata]
MVQNLTRSLADNMGLPLKNSAVCQLFYHGRILLEVYSLIETHVGSLCCSHRRDLTCPIDHLRPQHIYVYTFDLFVQSKALDGGAIDMLRRSGVEVHISQPPTKTKKKSNANHKGFPDYELGKAMHSWALERNPSPVLLISSDSRLRTDVSHIKSLRFEIILFHTKKAPKDLKDLCTKYALWFNGVAELT